MEFRGYDKNFSLSGKVALITGAGGGIGRAIATLFYEKGANLILLDLNPNIQNVGQEIAPDPKRLLTAAADITVVAQAEEAITAGLAKFGAIDILVNNAGVAPGARARGSRKRTGIRPWT
jgi:glycerol dehydrogenase